MARTRDHIAIAIKRAYVESRRLAQNSSQFNPAKKWEYAWKKAAVDVRKIKADVQTYVQAQFANHRPWPHPDSMYGPGAVENYSIFMQECHKNPLEEVKRIAESELLRFKSRVQFGDPIEKVLESPAAGFSPMFMYLTRTVYELAVTDDLRERAVRELILTPVKIEYYESVLGTDDPILAEARKEQKG